MRLVSVEERIKLETGKLIKESDITIFKISPKEGGCCCANCWRETWKYLNGNLNVRSPITHEGGAKVTINGVDLILEDHENGPEIITWINTGANLVNIIFAVRFIFDMIMKKRKVEKPSTNFTIKKIKYKNGKLKEEIVIEIPASADRKKMEKLLKDNIKL